MANSEKLIAEAERLLLIDCGQAATNVTYGSGGRERALDRLVAKQLILKAVVSLPDGQVQIPNVNTGLYYQPDGLLLLTFNSA